MGLKGQEEGGGDQVGGFENCCRVYLAMVEKVFGREQRKKGPLKRSVVARCWLTCLIGVSGLCSVLKPCDVFPHDGLDKGPCLWRLRGA